MENLNTCNCKECHVDLTGVKLESDNIFDFTTADYQFIHKSKNEITNNIRKSDYKNPETREWESVIIYHNFNDWNKPYIRNLHDFINTFIPVKVPSWLYRVINEYTDLIDRTQSLKYFIDESENYKSLSPAHQILLKDQLKTMTEYLRVITDRITLTFDELRKDYYESISESSKGE